MVKHRSLGMAKKENMMKLMEKKLELTGRLCRPLNPPSEVIVVVRHQYVSNNWDQLPEGTTVVRTGNKITDQQCLSHTSTPYWPHRQVLQACSQSYSDGMSN